MKRKVKTLSLLSLFLNSQASSVLMFCIKQCENIILFRPWTYAGYFFLYYKSHSFYDCNHVRDIFKHEVRGSSISFLDSLYISNNRIQRTECNPANQLITMLIALFYCTLYYRVCNTPFRGF